MQLPTFRGVQEPRRLWQVASRARRGERLLNALHYQVDNDDLEDL